MSEDRLPRDDDDPIVKFASGFSEGWLGPRGRKWQHEDSYVGRAPAWVGVVASLVMLAALAALTLAFTDHAHRAAWFFAALGVGILIIVMIFVAVVMEVVSTKRRPPEKKSSTHA